MAMATLRFLAKMALPVRLWMAMFRGNFKFPYKKALLSMSCKFFLSRCYDLILARKCSVLLISTEQKYYINQFCFSNQ